ILNGTDEKSLVERCRKGEDEAWRELVDAFGQKIFSVAYHFTLKREDAEELAQEIFLKVFENLHRYDGGFPLVAWILSLSRNLCIDRYRRRKRLFSALAETPEDLAEILVLRDLDGLAYDEIGNVLELPEGTVKSRLF